MQKVCEKLKRDMAGLELMLFNKACGLGHYKKELVHMGARILMLADLLDDTEFDEATDQYQALIYNYLACVCYYGSGNKNALSYLIKAKYN